MKLKTLKDIYPKQYLPNNKKLKLRFWCDETELKQEAIKWMKEIEELEGDIGKFSKGVVPAHQFIRNFFNITEEDLR